MFDCIHALHSLHDLHTILHRFHLPLATPWTAVAHTTAGGDGRTGPSRELIVLCARSGRGSGGTRGVLPSGIRDGRGPGRMSLGAAVLRSDLAGQIPRNGPTGVSGDGR